VAENGNQRKRQGDRKREESNKKSMKKGIRKELKEINNRTTRKGRGIW
jgi:hypothetical protein